VAAPADSRPGGREIIDLLRHARAVSVLEHAAPPLVAASIKVFQMLSAASRCATRLTTMRCISANA